MRALRDEIAPSSAELPAVVANLTVTEVPFGDGTVRAHADTTGGAVAIELGHRPEADLHLTLDHQTARALVVDQQPQDALRAFLLGKIKLEGDLSKILGEDADPMALLASFDLTGSTSLSDLDPTAAELAARVKAITA